jgi:hypothetical protein
MNEYEKYLFDLQGFLLVENALDANQIAQLNALVDERMMPFAEEPNKRFGKILTWDKSAFDVLDNPRILPYLQEIIGPQIRLDHDYLDVIRGGGEVKLGPIGAGLHGGSFPFDPSQYFHFRDGRFYNGLTVVAYNLHDVQEGEGGFACVPGSHKSNFAYPNAWRDLMQNEHQPFVRSVFGPAGSAVIFTEALTHGALPWRGTRDRRTLFLKYSPHPLSWSKNYYNAAEYEALYGDLTQEQRDLLQAPSARY